MIKFSDFMPVDFPDKTKVKFNMNAGNTALRAWDYLLDDAPEWVAMNAHKRKQANNNLNHADYLLAFAQYYPYGPQYYIFGGMYQVEKILPEVFDAVGYKLTLLPDYADYRKRLIIRLKKQRCTRGYKRYKETSGLIERKECQIFHSIFT